MLGLTWLGMVGGGGQKYGLLNRGSAILQGESDRHRDPPHPPGASSHQPCPLKSGPVSGTPARVGPSPCSRADPLPGPGNQVSRLKSQEFSVSLRGPQRAKVRDRPAMLPVPPSP